MQEALAKEVQQKVRDEILEVLKKNNLPHTNNIKDAVFGH